MDSFRDFMEEKKSPTGSKRVRFINYWRSLPNHSPLAMKPIPKEHEGRTTKGEDSIRVSGSAPFINSVMSRLKDVLALEGEDSKLQITFRQSKYQRISGERSFIMYVNVLER